MFRNRSFLVKMVKDEDPILNVEGLPGKDPIDYRDLAKVVTKSVSTCITVYITADTVRRAIIYAISAKL